MRNQELHPRTVVVNKKQKNQAKKTRNEALLWLATTFPRAFDNSVSIQPLKLGIMADILAHEKKAAEAGISKSKLREAVVLFARRLDYLTCLKAREMRIDLEGNAIAPVTEEEAAHAAEKIKKRIEKSVKNARKTLLNKPKNGKFSDKIQSSEHYSEDWEDENNILTPIRMASVKIKPKSRVYDPAAVARLKEKLGLSRQTGIEKETID